MALRSINKNFKNRGKDIKYLNKDFSQFKENLIEFARTYFPKAYNDFSDASPGTLFIEMAAYVGDVLSYYIDDTFKQSLMLYADDLQSVIPLTRYLFFISNRAIILFVILILQIKIYFKGLYFNLHLLDLFSHKCLGLNLSQRLLNSSRDKFTYSKNS